MFKKTIFQNTVNKHRTQDTEHRHRTQNTNTANFRSWDPGTVRNHQIHAMLPRYYNFVLKVKPSFKLGTQGHITRF